MNGEYEFERGESGAAAITRVQASTLHKGDLLMIGCHPCKIVSVSFAKVGKHGSMKMIVTGVDIFTFTKHETTFGSHDMIECPIIEKNEYILCNIEEDGYLSLLGGDLNLR